MTTNHQQKKRPLFHQLLSRPTNNPQQIISKNYLSHIQDKNLDVVLVYGVALAYVVIMFTLMVLKHNAFNTRIHDFARFSQAIWNTLDGQFLYTSLSERSILGDHFSPIMALFAPLLWIWPNERILFLVQVINVTATGLILYHLARSKHPTIAVFVALAFFLNPAVHEVTLFELRRIVFGMPWFALGLYGLVQKNKRLMLFGLLIAMLAKESIAIYVAMIGLYIIFKERDWRWGIGLVALGGIWSIVIGQFVIPQFNPGTDAYPQLYYYNHLGETYSDLIWLGLSDPLLIIQTIFGEAQLWALFRVFLPLGFLALLDLPLVLTITPYLALMFLSRDVDMFQLDKWYTTTITPILFAALISGWKLIPKNIERLAIGWVMVATLIAFSIYSYAPLGGRFDISIYQPTERDKVSELMTERVPEDQSIEAHPVYIPHLTHINEIYHYDFAGENHIDYVLLDSQKQFHIYGPFEIKDEVENLVAEPENVILEEVDGMYLIGLNKPQLLAYEVGKTAEDAILLDRFEVAIADENGFYENTNDAMPTVRVGDTIRVTLYWEALESDILDRSISTRLAANDGFLLTQRDQMPANNYRPMSWWETGTKVRDVYYLTVPEGTASQIGSVDIVLYDSLSQENVKFEGENEIMTLLPINIVSG